MKRLAVTVPFLLSLVLVQGVLGANIYVSATGTGVGSIADPAGLQAALNTAKANAEDDTIFLQGGNYANDPGFVYDVSGADPVSLTLSGGWDATYALQTTDPTLSAIDGQTARRGLLVQGDGTGVNATVTLVNLAVQNGLTTTSVPSPGDTGHGAGIYVRLLNEARIKLVLNGCVVQYNVVTHAESAGGGVYTTGDFALLSSNFVSNRADNSSGGALFSDFDNPYDASLAPTIDTCLFEANVSSAAGGAHLFTTVAPVVKGTTFKGRAGGLSSGGAGIFGERGSHLVFEGCRFVENVADGWGGAVYLFDSPGEIRNCLFVNNVAGAGGTGAGGAVMTDCDTTGTPHTTNIVNCTLVGNLTHAASPGTGGAVYNRLESITIANSILWSNGYRRSSDGYVFRGDSFALMNSTSGSTPCAISYSNAQGGVASTSFTDGGGNITEPATYSGANYTLPSNSACIDAGSNAAVPTGLDLDFQGDPRIFAVGDVNDRVVDMGWDEYADGGLALTAPAPGTAWFNDGTGKTITWTCQNIGGDVRLSLWKGDRATGSEVTQLAAAVPCADQSYAGAVLAADLPDAADYSIGIDSVWYPTIGHGLGPITTRHLVLSSPNGGQNLVQGTTYNVTWQSGNLPGATVRIELYKGASRARTIASAAANTGSFAWKPTYVDLPGPDYRIKLSTTSPLASEDWSDGYFRVLPALTLSAPNGGQSIKRGTTYKVTWTFKNKPGSFVRLDLYKGGKFNRVITLKAPIGTAGKGSFLWPLPANLVPGTDYTIRLRSTTYANCFDFSNKVFRITP